ncbi:hypothetical protein [Legionella sp.]|uniref:hypothetical protein n=1 Tax=Legionella sp. TaxID=459 RepID=UPI003CA8842A
MKADIDDFRFLDLLLIKKSVEKSSKSNIRDVDEKFNNLIMDAALIPPDFNKIVIFDDVLTTGATFKATKLKLTEIKNIENNRYFYSEI